MRDDAAHAPARARARERGSRCCRAIGVPAERVRSLDEAVRDPQLAHRELLARAAPDAPLVPVAAFGFAHDGPRLERRAPGVGEHTDEILREIGLRRSRYGIACRGCRGLTRWPSEARAYFEMRRRRIPLTLPSPPVSGGEGGHGAPSPASGDPKVQEYVARRMTRVGRCFRRAPEVANARRPYGARLNSSRCKRRNANPSGTERPAPFVSARLRAGGFRAALPSASDAVPLRLSSSLPCAPRPSARRRSAGAPRPVA